MGTGVGSPSTSTENAQTECVSCGKPYSGSHKCHKCNKLCHAIPPCSTPHSEEGFSASVTCHHCSKEAETNSQQEAAKENQMAQADRMLQRSARQLASLKVDSSVMVPIPEVDRGRAEFPNVKGIVMEPYSGFHKCHKCNKLCHAIPPCSTPHSEEGFSASVTCHHCSKEAETNSQQEAAKENQMAQADRMLQRSARQLAPLKVDSSVMVPIPEVDRGRAEFPNVKGIVMEVIKSLKRQKTFLIRRSVCAQLQIPLQWEPDKEFSSADASKNATRLAASVSNPT
ncbi:hypothetical protein DdX_03934 [Ditylenchus destructor]|uniref:SCAN domain-containing protein n=1 Tax=Ditylenchus destructor TaxID=166010 RepID=A0AAD4NB97_9BILA|nr:hypothetical protein DdX_03934 [Ditylenchus destructor]